MTKARTRAPFRTPRPDGRCPYCRSRMEKLRGGANAKVGPLTMTRDHIVPQAWGGGDWLFSHSKEDGVSNIKLCCADCNVKRGMVGHCVGAMACVQAVGTSTKRSFSDVVKAWGTHRIIPPPPKTPLYPQAEQPTPQRVITAEINAALDKETAILNKQLRGAERRARQAELAVEVLCAKIKELEKKLASRIEEETC